MDFFRNGPNWRRRHLLVVALLLVTASSSGCGWLDRTSSDAEKARIESGTLEAELAEAEQARADSIARAELDAIVTHLDTLSARITELRRDTGRRGGFEEFFADLGWKLLRSLVILLIAYYAIRFSVWILAIRAERSATRRMGYMKAIPIVRIIVWSIATYYIFRFVFLFDEESLIVAGGAIGVAVGFAAQDALKNVFGGIMIILDQPFQVGDKVRIEGTYGEVVSIGLRSTRIVTPDDNLVSVPNTQVVNGQVANANAGALDCQVVTEIFLPGSIDVERAKRIAYDAAATSKYVYLKKPIVVLVEDHYDYGFLTKIIVKAYVLDTRYEQVFSSDITERAKSEYLREGMLEKRDPPPRHGNISVTDDE